MTQFEIQGQRLDLPANFNLQLLRKNEIFAFDDVEVERSVSFDIPATANNLSILQLANDWHGAGQMMRVKIPATMIIGIVTIEGKMCVTQYDASKRTFKAIFVFGELLDLQALRDAGKFSELGLETDLYYNVGDEIYFAPSAKQLAKEWARVAYNAGVNNTNGSVLVNTLFQLLAEQRTELPAITPPQGLEGLRIIKGKINGFDTVRKLNATLNPEGGKQPSATPPENVFNLYEYDPTLFSNVDNAYFGYYTSWQGGSSQQQYNIQGLQVLVDMSITFPANFGEKWFLQKSAVAGGESGFYGGHWWEQRVNDTPLIHGAALAGQTVDFVAGDEFFVVNVDDFVYTSAGGLAINGWRFNDGNTFPFDFDIKVKGETRYFLRDNFPDFTPIELCKIIAGLKGLVLRYDKSRGVYFDDLTEWETMLLDDVIQVTTIERKFSDYAQRNYVRMKDDDNPEPLSVVYTIVNANLDEEKDLQEIPLASGVMGIKNQLPALGLVGDNDTLADTVEDRQYLQRVTMQKNATIQGFCDTSTAIQVQCLMNILKYVQIKPNTLFFYDGTLWAWSELQWNDGKLQAKLSKFSG